ncbi:hypothetical protein chiPu_0028323, partial [Chiloscyllium punctatum]|nr:hypothetical protein [Chiloscyllium punctatum]
MDARFPAGQHSQYPSPETEPGAQRLRGWGQDQRGAPSRL